MEVYEKAPACANAFILWPLEFSKEEVHQIIELAKKAGARVVKEPQNIFWGGYHAYFSDLDGYYWEVAYGPDFRFDENDMLIL